MCRRIITSITRVLYTCVYPMFQHTMYKKFAMFVSDHLVSLTLGTIPVWYFQYQPVTKL